jgi:hypothetical protein
MQMDDRKKKKEKTCFFKNCHGHEARDTWHQAGFQPQSQKNPETMGGYA